MDPHVTSRLTRVLEAEGLDAPGAAGVRVWQKTSG